MKHENRGLDDKVITHAYVGYRRGSIVLVGTLDFFLGIVCNQGRGTHHTVMDVFGGSGDLEQGF